MVLDFTYYAQGLPGAFAKPQRCPGAVRFFYGLFVHFLNPVGYACHLWRRPKEGKRLLSLPGGGNFAKLAGRLGLDLRTVWLGSGGCHRTNEQHPFSVEACPNDDGQDCWQCLYILQVELTLRMGETPVAATTNLLGSEEGAGEGGSSELEGEKFQRPLPDGWGQGRFGEAFGQLEGMVRAAPVHPHTGKPLGVGCRWERRYLDSLPQAVYVVAQPPEPEALEGNHLSSLALLLDLAVVVLAASGVTDRNLALATCLACLLTGALVLLTQGDCRSTLPYVAPPLVWAAILGAGISVRLVFIDSMAIFMTSFIAFLTLSVLSWPLACLVRLTRLGSLAGTEGRGSGLAMLACVLLFVLFAFVIGTPAAWLANIISLALELQPMAGLSELGGLAARFGLRGACREVAHAVCPCCVRGTGQMAPLRHDARYRRRGRAKAAQNP